MTPALRRVHQTIWGLLTAALPVGFGVALALVELPLREEPVRAVAPAPLPIVRQTVETDSLTASLLEAKMGATQQLEIDLKYAPEAPLIVRVRQHNRWLPIGILQGTAIYRFPMPGSDPHPQVDIQDGLHPQTRQMIQL